MEAIFVILALALLAGSVCGLITIMLLPGYRHRIETLERQVADQQDLLARLQSRSIPPEEQGAVAPEAAPELTSAPAEQLAELRREESQSTRETPVTPEESIEESIEEPIDQPQDSDEGFDSAARTIPTAASPAVKREPDFSDELAKNLQENWMIWLGGICVALAGIFLVRYSIEQGLLGPTARIIGGLIIGAGLHVGAEWLRRKTEQNHQAFAALAGAGSITLYASLLAAMRLYDLVGPGTAFIGMAVVALATMALAYLHGPVLAAFGILGAYLVPILVSDGGGQVVVAMIYALIVTASALLLLRFVYRPWLWWGMMTGAVGWWFLTLDTSGADGFRPYYLALLTYMLVSLPSLDWLLRRREVLEEESYSLNQLLNIEPEAEKNLVKGLLIITGALGLSILVNADYAFPWYSLLPLAVLTLVARTRESLFWLPWLAFATVLLAWFLPRIEFLPDGWQIAVLLPENQLTFLYFLGTLSIVASVFALWSFATGRFRLASSSLATVGPVLALTVGYLLTAHLIKSWYWGLGTALMASAYLIVATRASQRGDSTSLVVWLFVAGHFALALAAAMVLNAATLTLALALQIVSVGWVIKKFEVAELDWLFKLVVGAVVVRLTINPWLVEYPAEVHWPLWTYGGSVLCALAAIRILKGYPAITRWAEAAALHLFVLTIWAELRYLLYDGVVFESEFTFTEAVINIALFGALSLVYYRRSLVSENLSKLYLVFSYLLMAMSLGNYLCIGVLTLATDPWVYDAVSATPFFNALLGAYGVPVVLGVLFASYHQQAHRKWALAFASLSGLVFISLQVRHLWEGTINLGYPPVSPGELYSYSVVWLMIAVGAILGGAWRYGQDMYRAGMILLAIVIAKLFLVDMSDLEGLLRVASFMGLGLSLLGISFLHQKLKEPSSEDVSGEASS